MPRADHPAAGRPITPPCHGRYLTAHLPAARYLEQPGNHLLWIGDTDSLFAQIEELVTGSGHQPRSERVLCTLMAANTVQRDNGAQDARTAATRDAIGAHGGRLLRRGDDGVLAAFDGPARTIRCAAPGHGGSYQAMSRHQVVIGTSGSGNSVVTVPFTSLRGRLTRSQRGVHLPCPPARGG